MVILVLTLFLSLMANLKPPAVDCSKESIARLEDTIRGVDGHIVVHSGRLDSLQSVMNLLAEDILKERGRADDIGARRKLARLMQESRDLADRMNAENREVRDLTRRRADAAAQLHQCHTAHLNETLAALAGAVRRRERVRAETLLGEVQLLEGKIREVGSLQKTSVLPVLSEEFIAATPRSEPEIEFLVDTLEDLYEKAVRDSSDTFAQLDSERSTLRLKRELRDLLGEADVTGMNGSGFFENLRSNDIDDEIVELERRVGKMRDAHMAIRAAVVYYQNAIAALSRAEEQ